MNLALRILTVTMLSLAFNWFLPALPWYTTFIISFLVGIYSGRMKTKAFLAGFIGVAFFWGVLLLSSHLKSDGLVTLRISALFTEQMAATISPIIVILMTLLIGSLLGGLSALSGQLLSMPTEGTNRYGRHNRRNKSSYKLKL